MAESTFRIPSNINIDTIDIDVSSPVNSQVILHDGTKFVSGYHVPVGTIEMWGGLSTNVPYGWLLCDGQQILSTSALGVVLSTRYNTGGETAGNVRVPNMSTVLPMGITSGANANTPTFSYPSSDVTHTHASFTNATATTNSDGANHSHTYQDGGTHNHTAVAANFGHAHNTNNQSTTHYHNTGGANITNATSGATAHVASLHGNPASDNAAHSHTAGTQSAPHSHNITGAATTHNHTWAPNATGAATTTAGSHNHTITVVSISFIIKS